MHLNSKLRFLFFSTLAVVTVTVSIFLANGINTSPIKIADWPVAIFAFFALPLAIVFEAAWPLGVALSILPIAIVLGSILWIRLSDGIIPLVAYCISLLIWAAWVLVIQSLVGTVSGLGRGPIG